MYNFSSLGLERSYIQYILLKKPNGKKDRPSVELAVKVQKF